MKKIFKANYITIFLAFFLLLLGSTTAFAASDYNIVINNMDYNIIVNENHTYDIQVTEDVTFKTYYHGIYRAIAKSGTFYREVDGKETADNYNAVIKNVQVESGQNFITDTDGDAFIIQIGDEDRYVIGKQTYTYSYQYDPGDDGSSSYDDVYQNIITQYLENPVEHLSITIEMPKPFDSDDVHFFNGQYASTNANEIDYQIKGNTIYAESTKTITPGEVVSIRIVLPDGYFVNVFTGHEVGPIYWGIAAVLLIIGLAIYFLKGRAQTPLEPVTFYPPKDFDSTQVAYVLKQKVSNESLVSLLIYFASKGWLTIENISEDPEKEKYRINKVEDIPSDRPSFEKTIFNALFKRSDNPKLDELVNKKFMGNAFITANQQVRDWFTGKNKITSNSAILSKVLISLLLIINSLSISIIGSIYAYREIEFEIFVILFFITLIGPFIMAIGNSIKDRVIGGVFIVVASFLTYIFIESLTFCLINLVLSLVLGYLISESNRRTPEGNILYGECKGFEHFIETAELPRLKLLVEEDPEYFYNILPYAYALGLTDKWAKNFEGIALNPPNWYYDPYFDYILFRNLYFMNTFNRGIRTNINHINTQSVRGMGSGGFGGGFSGGGFGGGGGGGIGGGGW